MPNVSRETATSTITPVNLRFTIWSANDAHLDLLNELAEAYSDEHPEVTIQFDILPPGDYAEKIFIQLAGNNPPDLGWIREDSALAFISSAALVDLKPTLTNYPDYDLADFSTSALQLWSQGNAIYAIPFSTSPYFILFNRDLFEAAGAETPDSLAAADAWTWQALATVAREITAVSPADIYGFESKDGAVYTDRAWQTLIPMIWAYGGDAWDSGGTRCLLASEEAISAVQLYHDMVFVDKSAVPPEVDGDFYAGRSAMTLAQLSRSARLENVSFALGIAPIPDGPADDMPMVIGQAAIAVFEASPHKETAADFVAFMTNKSSSARLAEYFPSARTTVLESPEFLEANALLDSPRARQLVVSAINNGRVLPSHVNFPLIDLTTRSQFQELWQPDADVASVLQNICQTIAPILNE
jgi:multiple sugar transport system substrate-binding protein